MSGRFLLLLMMMFWAMGNLFSQTTWNGSVSTAWNTADNWSAGVPDAADAVTIPDVTNDPTLSTIGAVAQSVSVESGAVLTISAAGSLNLNGAAAQSIFNLGTVENSGTLTIGATATAGFYGIANAATFNNNTGGAIIIDQSTTAGLYNLSGTFTNSATLTIGATAGVGLYGIQNETTFNNNTGGTILIDRSTSIGLYNSSGSSFTNSAAITIGATASVGTYGIQNAATFNNNTGGAINIDHSTGIGLYNLSGTFTNQAAITIGATVSVGSYGIQNIATFNNNTGGAINIDRSTDKGLYNIGIFTNQAAFTIGATASVGNYGIYNAATFNNNTGGTINIDRSANRGLRNFSGTFINQAAITIGAIASVGSDGITNQATFNNNTGGAINIDNTANTGLHNFSGGIFTNQAAITIGAIASVGSYGIYNQATFNNNTGGTINIGNSNIAGLYNLTGTFTNQAAITIGAITSVGTYGIQNEASFNNNPGGAINIDRSTSAGLYNLAGTFTNQAAITIGATVSVGLYGIRNDVTFNNNTGGVINIDRSGNTGLYNFSGSTFTNQAAITIGATASVGFYGIRNEATFNNNTGGTMNIEQSLVAGIRIVSGTFTNQAAITIGALVPMTDLMTASTGTFSNSTGGTLKGTGNLPAANFTNTGGTLAPGYSPGKMTFTAGEDFSNSILSIEVNGITDAGTDFDQIVVSGTATLGGTLVLSINYAGVNGDQVTILSATALSGTFGTVTGLGSWFVNYTSTAVILSFGAPLPVELTDFTARFIPPSWEKRGASVQLDWRTASESNNLGFDIERSNDGQHWEALGFVAGNGTTTETNDYSFLDEKPLPGMNYYRLRQEDFDGQSEYSKVVSVEVEREGSSISLFPNPTTGIIEIQGKNSDEGTIRVADNVGRLIKVQQLSGYKQIDLSNLPNGMYFIYILTDSQSTVKRIIKE
jgi:Secretion system C-terminal sorting domain